MDYCTFSGEAGSELVAAPIRVGVDAHAEKPRKRTPAVNFDGDIRPRSSTVGYDREHQPWKSGALAPRQARKMEQGL